MEQRGAVALDRNNLRLSPGDAVVVPIDNSYLFPLPGQSVVPWFAHEVNWSSWVSTMDGTLGAGILLGRLGAAPVCICAGTSRKVSGLPCPLRKAGGACANAEWAFAALPVVIGLLLHASLFGGRGLVPADGVLVAPPWVKSYGRQPSNYLLVDQYTAFLPVKQFFSDEVHQGRFPLWNPHLGFRHAEPWQECRRPRCTRSTCWSLRLARSQDRESRRS
jgi:hypothetical protein